MIPDKIPDFLGTRIRLNFEIVCFVIMIRMEKFEKLCDAIVVSTTVEVSN